MLGNANDPIVLGNQLLVGCDALLRNAARGTVPVLQSGVSRKVHNGYVNFNGRKFFHAELLRLRGATILVQPAEVPDRIDVFYDELWIGAAYVEAAETDAERDEYSSTFRAELARRLGLYGLDDEGIPHSAETWPYAAELDEHD